MISGAKTLTAIDKSESAIREARERFAGHAHFLVGDMSKLDIASETIDTVVCLEGIEHVPMDIGTDFIDEAHRVLRTDGVLMISSPYCRDADHSGNPYHVHEYRPFEIMELLGRRFDVAEVVERDVDILTVLYIRARKR